MSDEGQDSLFQMLRNRIQGSRKARADAFDSMQIQGEIRAADIPGEAVAEVVRRDYYTVKGEPWPFMQAVTHCPERDLRIKAHNLMEILMNKAGAKDGDEVQVLVVLTGRRPFGDRRFLTKDGVSGPETDEACLARIEGTQLQDDGGNKDGD